MVSSRPGCLANQAENVPRPCDLHCPDSYFRSVLQSSDFSIRYIGCCFTQNENDACKQMKISKMATGSQLALKPYQF